AEPVGGAAGAAARGERLAGTGVGVIEAVVVLPGAPALVPELMGAATAELDPLRSAAQEAVHRALDAVDQSPEIVVVGAADPERASDDTHAGRWAGRVSGS